VLFRSLLCAAPTHARLFGLGVVTAPLALALILGTASIAGLVGLTAALVIGGVTWILLQTSSRPQRALTVFMCTAAVVAVAALALVFSQLPVPPPLEQLTGATYDQPMEASLPLWLVDAHRQQIWGFALEAGRSSPIVGYGMDTSNHVPGASIVIEQFNQAFIPAHPHNWVLEIFMDGGALGLAGLIVALIFIVRQWARSTVYSTLTTSCGMALFAAFWTSSLFNFSIWLTWWQGVFLLLTAMMFAGGVKRTRPSTR